MDCSPPGSSVRGILQARTLEWVAVPSSKRSSQPRDWIYVSYSWEVGSLPLASPGKPNNLPKVIPKKKENTETQSWGILVCLSSSPSTSTALGSCHVYGARSLSVCCWIPKASEYWEIKKELNENMLGKWTNEWVLFYFKGQGYSTLPYLWLDKQNSNGSCC